MMEIRGEGVADYFNFRCSCNGGRVKTTFLGYGPIPMIRFDCDGCGEYTHYKIDNTTGFPRNPVGHDHPLHPETLKETGG